VFVTVSHFQPRLIFKDVDFQTAFKLSSTEKSQKANNSTTTQARDKISTG
jgi:hypothetical protein